MPIPLSIRFAQLACGRGERLPALIAAVSRPDGDVGGIQRTFLAPDGSRKATLATGKPKLSLGRVRGGAIRLAEAAEELIVAEGLEDGLSLQQETGCGVWVAAGASMLPSVELPSIVEKVIVAADNDAPGEAAATRAAEAFSAQGRRVRIVRPALPHKDFNDELRAGLP